ncbi:MAG: FAD-binding oxidoreductase [Myxococcota bacterium]
MSERERSFWAWGWADGFPDRAARRNLANMVSGVLGFEKPDLREPPSLDDVRIPGPRLEVPPTLSGFTTDDREARARRTYGRGYRDLVRGFRGDFSGAPDLVALPRDEDEVAAALRWASAHQVAVVPRGGGTSVVGGVEADVGEGYGGVLCLDLGRMDRVLEVEPVSRTARIQAGATGPGLEAGLAEHGLTLRHFPQSFEFSTLGGWIATRAGGHFATVYTHIDDLVASIRTVTPRGEMATRRLPGSGAGPSPDRLMMGSEGILGVITEAWMRVRPRPRFRASATALFDDWTDAVDATRAVAQSGLFPSNCRLLDEREAMLNQVPSGGRHVLVLGFEAADHDPGSWLDEALRLVGERGGECPEGPVLRDDSKRDRPKGAEAWRSAFLQAPYLQSAFVSMGLIADTFETACPWDRFEALHRDVIANVRAAMKERCGAGTITCRFTHVYPDGPAPYFTFLAPAREGHELEQWAAIKQAASDTLMAHEATITHHHAVGRVHRPWYDRQRPELFARALRAAKRELDPAWILNPGVLVDR